MAAVKQDNSRLTRMVRVSPLKPGLRGSQNWMAAKVRAAQHSPRAMIRFIFSILTTLLVLAFLAVWMGGGLPAMRQGIVSWKIDRLMAMGFVVEKIDVMGEGRLNEADILAAIDIAPGSYFFAADLEKAQIRAESLPWVDRVVVRRLWPNRIAVQVVETTPYALWQNSGELYLLAKDGTVIIRADEAASVPAGLKVFVGPEAHQSATLIEADLRAYPQIWADVRSLVQHRSGRWDLYMETGTVIRLPDVDRVKALARLEHLRVNNALLARPVSVIDLRLGDRIGILPRGLVSARSQA